MKNARKKNIFLRPDQSEKYAPAGRGSLGRKGWTGAAVKCYIVHIKTDNTNTTMAPIMDGRRIFIVEDERIVALDLQERLRGLGHTIVGSVAAGDEALKKLAQSGAELVLTDIKLGGKMDGVDLADSVQHRYNLPVIFITAYSDHQTLERVKNSKACGFIIKPFTDKELQATIDIGLHEHELEMQLRRSEEQYRRLFDEAPVGYHEIDLNGSLVRVNRTELAMLGYTEAEMIGRPVGSFMLDGDSASAGIVKKLSVDQISSHPFERNYRCKDGRLITVLITDYPIRSAAGKLLGVRSTIQDISRLKEERAKIERLEDSLRQAEKLEGLSDMAGGLAHELNNQLMAIQGNAALALLNSPSSGANEVHRYLQDVLEACRRATTTVKQLLVCAGMVKGEFGLVNLSEIIAELEPTLREVIAAKAKLRLKTAVPMPPISGDSGQLKQLVTILVTNAVEAIESEGGIVEVETGVEQITEHNHNGYEIILRKRPFIHGRQCYLSVVDNGRGMDKKTRVRLFDPFFTTKGVGRGLGLPAALGIVKNHDGDIMLKSLPGGGTTVRIVFPCGVAAGGAGRP